MPSTLEFGTDADYQNRNRLVDALKQRVAAGMESVPWPSLKKQQGDTIRATPAEVDPLAFAAPTKLVDARRVIAEIMQEKFPQGIAVKRLEQYPFGFQHVQRVDNPAYFSQGDEIWKTPTIRRIPYPGANTESDLARILGDPVNAHDTAHYGFYSPKGKARGLGGEQIHRDALDRLLGYESPRPMAGNHYVNDLFYENPIEAGHVYDIPEMLSDTGLTRVFRSNPRVSQPSYLDVPPNITDEQMFAIDSQFGKPPAATLAMTVPNEIRLKFMQHGPPNIHERYYVNQIRNQRDPTSKMIADMIGRYSEDLTRYFR